MTAVDDRPPRLAPIPAGPVPLPCARCRRPVDREELVWLTPRTSSTLIRQVGCRDCANGRGR